MTDNEIGKALDEAELFLRNRTMDGMSLELNEYDIGILRDISQVCARAYDEIIRQKAEVERLNGCVKSEEEVRTIMKSQMMPMVSEIVNEQFDVAVKLARAEAIKEFAERLKEKIYIKKDKGLYFEKIDYLVKEMVGDV